MKIFNFPYLLGVLVNMFWVFPGLWDAAIVPWISLLWVDIGNVSEVTLLDILLDWVHFLLGGDFHLGIGPAGHFDDHVVDFVTGSTWDIVEGTKLYIKPALSMKKLTK